MTGQILDLRRRRLRALLATAALLGVGSASLSGALASLAAAPAEAAGPRAI
ncbi:hypothetical protein [Sphingosinicella sp. CPCC 101087]|uniref:hypothetical protein n=1 Tax=Sphingosinicella sp. CPCC 101087 TaxID=2497754 RepID=UPI0013EC56A7|nr:hypothetical protein [Sphingosinicella sp. CPCC 101087]